LNVCILPGMQDPLLSFMYPSIQILQFVLFTQILHFGSQKQHIFVVVLKYIPDGHGQGHVVFVAALAVVFTVKSVKQVVHVDPVHVEQRACEHDEALMVIMINVSKIYFMIY
jgi:malonyl CoA-acyl carrier protein transacylase